MMFGVLYLKFQMFLNSEVVADSGRCCIMEDAVSYCIQLNNIALLAEPTCYVPSCLPHRQLVNSLVVYGSLNTQ